MTREEAKKIVKANWPTNQYQMATAGLNQGLGSQGSTVGGLMPAHQPLTPGSFVALCEKLGMLKLDEPKSVLDAFIEQLVGRGFTKRDAEVVRTALDYSNLKIVEK